jgi:hypothetical protein
MFDPPLSDRELWDCAILIETRHGERTPGYISDRMIECASQGDVAAIDMWKAIADRYDQLQARHRGPLPA